MLAASLLLRHTGVLPPSGPDSYRWRSVPSAPGRLRVIAAVSAPSDTTQRQQAKAVASIPVSQQREAQQQQQPQAHNPVLSYFSSAISGIAQLWVQQGSKSNNAELLQETAQRAAEAKAEEERSKGDKKVVPDIREFIKPAGMMETRYVRLLSSLCAQTYVMPRLTPRSLFRRFRLQLVTSSQACERNIAEVPRTANQVFGESDAMAVTASQDGGDWEGWPIVLPPTADEPTAHAPLQSQLDERLPTPEEEEIVAALAALSSMTGSSAGSLNQVDQPDQESVPIEAATPTLQPLVAAASPPDSGKAGSSNTLQRQQELSGAHLVASKLAAAAAAASAAAAAAAAPLANGMSSLASAGSAMVASQLQSAANAGTTTAVATFATVSAAITASLERGEPQRVKVSPVEWFVADEPETHTRYFVIQGSDNFDHWKVNLTFDPMEFEDPALGVKVHRGVYQTALALYERFLPLVEEHVNSPDSSPFAKVAFTGHSLGGSLATLLLLMYMRRGVLPAVNVSPTYTFGSPAVFCEGGCGAGGCKLHDTADGTEPGEGLLAKLGLAEGSVRNVLIARDIVPRAFACDYTLVADILKRVSPAFRQHRCLSGGRRVVLYYAIGRSLILQPSTSHWFAEPEPYHPMLPAGPGLYVLRDPAPVSPPQGAVAPLPEWPDFTPAAAAVGLPDADSASEAGRQRQQQQQQQQLGHSALGGSGDQEWRPAMEAAGAAGQRVPNARAALSALMDFPHPLDILGDPAAYGPEGGISRFHNPDNYTAGLGGVLRAQPWWRELLAVGPVVSPPACSGPRTFSPAASARQADRDAARGASAAARPPPPDVPINQVLPYVKPLFAGSGASSGGGGHEVAAPAS